jgi:Protein of unknown function (DUF2752)
MDSSRAHSLPRWRAIRGDLGLAGTGAVAVALLHFRDPHAHGAYGFCPFHVVTGWWCPACGGLRAVNDLTDGRVLASLHSNVLLLPFVATVAVFWTHRAWLRWTARQPHSTAVFTRTSGLLTIAGVTIFTVLRNTPWGHWLAPS